MRLCVGTAKGIVVLDADRNGAPIALSAVPSSVICLAQCAARPELLYAAVNEMDGMPAVGVPEGTLYRSEDGGRSWSELTPRVMHGDTIWAMATPPDRPAELWVGTARGRLLRSEDYGRSFEQWRAEFAGRERRAGAQTPIKTIVFEPQNPAQLFIGLAGGPVYRSLDYGRSFVSLEGKIRALHAIAADGAHLYATSEGGFYRCQNQSWEPITRGLTRSYLYPLAVDSAGIVYTAGAGGPPATWMGSEGADAALFLSRDQGRSFSAFGGMFGARRGMIMQIVPAAEHLFATVSDGAILRWRAGEEEVAEMAAKLPPAFAVAAIP